MVSIGDSLHRDTRAIITDMNEPLGLAIGNALEVKEAIDTLQGRGPRDFVELVTEAGSIMLQQARIAKNREDGVRRIQAAIADGSGFRKQKELFAAQGGDIAFLDHPDRFPLARQRLPIYADEAGYIKRIDSLTIGLSAMKLGAGRSTMTDVIDMAAGIVLNKKVGDYAHKGELLATAHTNKEDVAAILEDIRRAFAFSETEVAVRPIVHAYIH
jgi:pyrimidine-nucleoside phosphorylase